MTNEEKNKLEEDDILEEMEQEIEDIENEDGEVDEEKLEEAIHPEEKKLEPEEEKCRDVLARTVADFENFKKRTDRDKQDMIFFLKSDILKKVLPRIDDIERIIKNTPEEMQTGVLFEGLTSLEKKFKKDLEQMHVKPFKSIGNEVNPDFHDVMTTVPGEDDGIIFDEFEKGYMLGDKVLRHAKVIVGSGHNS